MWRRGPRWAGAALLFALYVAGGLWGLMFDPVGGVASPVWAPTGVALAAVLLLGWRAGAGVAVAAVVVNLWAGVTPLAAAVIACGNAAEALIGAALLRAVGFRNALDRLRDVLALLVLGAVVSTAVSATGGLAAVSLAHVPADSGLLWRVWWLGDAIGDVLVAPLLLVWAVPAALRWRGARAIEPAVVLVAQLAVTALVFRSAGGGLSASWVYVVFPGLIWAALRLGLRGAVTAEVLTAAAAVWGTAAGRGPFAGGNPMASLVALQSFMGLVGVTVLVLAVSAEERRRESQRREELLDMVAHDLRNPLAAIVMNAGYLLRGPAPADRPRWHAQLRMVADAADRMRRMIDDLLASAGLEAGTLAVERAAEPLSGILDEAAELLQPLVDRKQLRLVRRDEIGAQRVWVDRARVLQVLSNLIGNAIHYTPDGGAITLAAEVADDCVRVSVSDEGPGIDPAQLAHVFDRYWRGASPARGGLGLGLYIAQGLVAAHNGRLWVESAPGRGSTFYFTLPRV